MFEGYSENLNPNT